MAASAPDESPPALLEPPGVVAVSSDQVRLLTLLTMSLHFTLFFNLRAKRGGSLFEAGSEREENGGVASVQKWCA